MTSFNHSKSIKIRLEFTDETGSTYNFNVENPSKEGVTRLLDFANSISVIHQEVTESDNEPIDTNFSRLYSLLQSKFKFGTFTSHDVLEAYQQEVEPDIPLSIISTYLSRLTKRMLVTRKRIGSTWNYRLSQENQISGEKISLINEHPQLTNAFSPKSDNLYVNGFEAESLIK